jgi:AGCS family alanine or glycine:cation symporter
VLIIGLVCWGATTDLGTVFAFADVTMGLLALVNLIALIFLFKPALRILRDFDGQIAAGVEQPVFDAKRFADMNVDTDAWEIEPEDLERLRQHTGDVVQAR